MGNAWFNVVPLFLTADDFLADPDLRQAALAYSNREGSPENIEFLLAVRDYKANPTADGARDIYDNFVEGPKLINIPGEVREQLRRWIHPELPKDLQLDKLGYEFNEPPAKPEDLFNQAETRIKDLFGRDTVSRFVKSDKGKDAVDAFMKRVGVDKNLGFEVAVFEYTSKPSRAAARQIFDQYLSDKAASPMNISAKNRETIRKEVSKWRPWAPSGDLFATAKADVESQTKRAIRSFTAAAAATPPGLGLHDPGRDLSAAAGAGDGALAPAADRASDINTESGSGAGKGLNLDGLDGLAAAGAAAGGGESISGPPKAPARPPDRQTQPAPQADFNPDRKPEEEKTGKEHAE